MVKVELKVDNGSLDKVLDMLPVVRESVGRFLNQGAVLSFSSILVTQGLCDRPVQ